jgi:hypothetical protein
MDLIAALTGKISTQRIETIGISNWLQSYECGACAGDFTAELVVVRGVWPVTQATSKPSFSGQEIRLSRIVHNRCFEASANAKGTSRLRQIIPAATRSYIESPVL